MSYYSINTRLLFVVGDLQGRGRAALSLMRHNVIRDYEQIKFGMIA